MMTNVEKFWVPGAEALRRVPGAEALRCPTILCSGASKPGAWGRGFAMPQRTLFWGVKDSAPATQRNLGAWGRGSAMPQHTLFWGLEDSAPATQRNLGCLGQRLCDAPAYFCSGASKTPPQPPNETWGAWGRGFAMPQHTFVLGRRRLLPSYPTKLGVPGAEALRCPSVL